MPIGPVVDPADGKAVKVDVLPAEGHLEDLVQVGQRRGGRDHEPSPDEGTDPPKHDAQLVDGRAGLILGNDIPSA